MSPCLQLSLLLPGYRAPLSAVSTYKVKNIIQFNGNIGEVVFDKQHRHIPKLPFLVHFTFKVIF